MKKFKIGQQVEIRHLRATGTILAINTMKYFPILVEYTNKIGDTVIDWLALVWLNELPNTEVIDGFTMEHEFQ